MVIFHRIARLQNHGALQPRNGGDQRGLRIGGQRGRNAIGVDDMIVRALRLQKDLVPVAVAEADDLVFDGGRSEEHTSELQSLMRISYAVFCLKKKKQTRYQK